MQLLKSIYFFIAFDKPISHAQPLSGHSFRVGAALGLLKQGELLERIMLTGGLANRLHCNEESKKLVHVTQLFKSNYSVTQGCCQIPYPL